jgi:predicted XRE-type DNA-binding protein
MVRALIIKERAKRQRVMMKLRAWIDKNSISRQEVADHIGITKGHLSTLINANRTASKPQVEKALKLIDNGFELISEPKPVKSRKKRPKSKKVTKRKPPKKKDPRALTKVESDFVKSISQVWVDGHPDASEEEFDRIVNALTIGVRRCR